MVFAKRTACCAKAGYTLVEVLVVVVIMGILSAMGVAGLQGAVANARVKDAAVNTAAFVERVANLSRQYSSPICLEIMTGKPHILYAIRSSGSDCAAANKKGGVVDSLIVDSPLKFVENGTSSCNAGVSGSMDLTKSENAVFKPQLGLSSAPPEGIVCVQYGDDTRYGVAWKRKTSNSVKAYWKIGSSSGDSGWNEL